MRIPFSASIYLVSLAIAPRSAARQSGASRASLRAAPDFIASIYGSPNCALEMGLSFR